MAKPIHEMSTWGHSRHHSRLPDEEWQVTRELTQIVGSHEEYLANEARDIGRRISDDTHELFVVCQPAEAMVQQLQHLKPELIAVHDIACDSSRRLIAGLAAATGSKVQKLLIRRQGYGMPLATLEFAELPGPAGQTLRVYSTIADADTQQRQQLVNALLSHARLAVIIAGDLPPHALATALEPMREGISRGPWPNQNLLMVPLGGSTALSNAAPGLAGRSGITVRVTPQAMKPGDAWGYISLAWDRLRKTGSMAAPAAGAYGSPDQSLAFVPGTAPARAPAPAPAPVARAAAPAVVPRAPAAVAAQAPVSAPTPLPMQPMPAVKPRAPLHDDSVWAHYAHAAAEVRGVVSCAVIDTANQRALAHAGARPGPAALATHGGQLWDQMLDTARQLGLQTGAMEMVLTLAGHQLILRAIAGRPGLALFAVLDRSAADPAQAIEQLNALRPISSATTAAPAVTH